MAPDGIVEPVDVAANGLVGFLASAKDGPPDELGFQGLEERLHHGVVVAITLAGHRDQDAVLPQRVLSGLAPGRLGNVKSHRADSVEPEGASKPDPASAHVRRISCPKVSPHSGPLSLT